MAFTKATKEQLKLRMGLFAPSGGGKTYTALMFAQAMGPRIAYIDTENRSSAKYVGTPGVPAFDIAQLDYSGDNAKYIDAMVEMIKEAERFYDCLVIDSLTHAWTACKDEVDTVAKRMRTPNSYTAWREGTTVWSRLIAAIVGCKCHLIVCARSKMDYVQEKDEKGRTQVRKVGMAPELRDGMEYELDIVGEMDIDHTLVITKSRCHVVADAVAKKPGVEFMAPIKEWLGSGVAAEPRIDWEAKARELIKGISDDKKPAIAEIWKSAQGWEDKCHAIQRVLA
jgi:hypothetical protein